MFYAGESLSKLTTEKLDALTTWEQEGLEPLQSFLWEIVQSYARSEWEERMQGITIPFTFGKCQDVLRKLRDLVSHLGKKCT